MTPHDGDATPEDLAADLTRWHEALHDGAFEQTFRALEEVVERLDLGQLRLEETLSCYELGVRLAARCGRILDEAELRVTRLDESLGEAAGWETDESDEDTPPTTDESG